MSHIHNVGGYPNSAVEIQAQLEQMRAARFGRKAEKSAMRPARTFDTEVEANFDREKQDEPQQENQNADGSNEESPAGPGREPEPDEKPGVRYA
jgi:hypothetical protein